MKNEINEKTPRYSVFSTEDCLHQNLMEVLAFSSLLLNQNMDGAYWDEPVTPWLSTTCSPAELMPHI